MQICIQNNSQNYIYFKLSINAHMNNAAHHNIICFLLSKSFSSSSNSTAPTTIPTLSNIPFTINVKLHSSNYLMWKAQALPYFRSHYLPRSNYIPFSYLDGTIFIPPKEIDFSDSVKEPSQPNSLSCQVRSQDMIYIIL